MKKHTEARLEDAIIDQLNSNDRFVFIGCRTALITAATTGKIDVRGVKIPEKNHD